MGSVARHPTRSARRGLALTIAILLGGPHLAAAQNAGMGMAMPTNTLLVAQLDAKQVVGGSSSSATGTGAFLLDPVKHTLEYSLTYQGLEAGGAKSIALHNFGLGKNGDAVRTLCGAGAQPCPDGSSVTIAGRLERGDGRALDNDLIGEFDSERVYVEIVGGNGKPEIRGQLAPNGAMVKIMNYVAHLAPAEGTKSNGSGTAILSETYLPGGRVSVLYVGTVAGTSGAPTNAALAGGPASKAVFSRKMALPQLKLRFSRDKKTGGSLSGFYEVKSAARDALLATRLEGNGAVGIVVTTSRFPKGELYGALEPVR
ncbi:CHRD domain-containing protein [Rhizobiales bacterium GAS191]|nr:CHRD domain-containing protein [Rhizobiales bacterium GAS191]